MISVLYTHIMRTLQIQKQRRMKEAQLRSMRRGNFTAATPPIQCQENRGPDMTIMSPPGDVITATDGVDICTVFDNKDSFVASVYPFEESEGATHPHTGNEVSRMHKNEETSNESDCESEDDNKKTSKTSVQFGRGHSFEVGHLPPEVEPCPYDASFGKKKKSYGL